MNTQIRTTDSQAGSDTSDEAILENSLTGNRVLSLQRKTDADGEHLQIEVSVTPQTEYPLVEFGLIDPSQQQRIQVLEGTMRATVADEALHPERYAHLRDSPLDQAEKDDAEPLTIREGQEISVPPQTGHRFWNDSDNSARVRIKIWPALEFEQFLRFQYEKARREHKQAQRDAALKAFNGDDVIENPVSGEKIRFLERAADTDGKSLRFEMLVPPKGKLLNLRPKWFMLSERESQGAILPKQTKYVKVRSGRLLARSYEYGGLYNDTAFYALGFWNPLMWKAKTAGKGIQVAANLYRGLTVAPLLVLEDDEIVVQPGVPHRIWNPSNKSAVVRVELRPALKSEQLLEMLYGLARDGLTSEDGMPRSRRQWHVLLEAYKREFRLPKSRTKTSLIANVGEFLGKSRYKAWKPEYSPDPERSALAGIPQEAPADIVPELSDKPADGSLIPEAVGVTVYAERLLPYQKPMAREYLSGTRVQTGTELSYLNQTLRIGSTNPYTETAFGPEKVVISEGTRIRFEMDQKPFVVG